MSYKRSDSSKSLRDELKLLAKVCKVTSTIPIQNYYKYARSLYDTYLKENSSNNLEQLYVQLQRLATLSISEIPSHNAFNLKQNQDDKFWIKRVGEECLRELENITANLDDIEDRRLQSQLDLELIDEFDFVDDSPNDNDKSPITQDALDNKSESHQFDTSKLTEKLNLLKVPGYANEESSSITVADSTLVTIGSNHDNSYQKLEDMLSIKPAEAKTETR